MNARNSLLIGMRLFVPFIGIGVALALLLPAQAEAYPDAVLSWSGLMSVLIPSIEGFTSVSQFPVVTEVFLAIHWSMCPVLAIVVFCQPQLVAVNQRTLKSWPRWKIVMSLILVTGIVVAYPISLRVTSDDLTGGLLHEIVLKNVSTSRLWLGLIGSCVIFCAAYWIALSTAYLRAFFTSKVI